MRRPNRIGRQRIVTAVMTTITVAVVTVTVTTVRLTKILTTLLGDHWHFTKLEYVI